MRKISFMLVLIPFLGITQTKNVVSTQRVFPKADKALEFEKALAAHAQKYHKGDFRWRVFEIESGPDFGGYQITEGPTNWTTFDGRGNLGTEHNNDWNRSVAIYLTDRGSSSYLQFEDTLSTVQLTDYADKVIINHIMPKPGMINNLRAMITKMKKAWTAGNESVAVYTSVFSGNPQIAVVTRLKGGLKELEPNFRKPMQDRYIDANGPGSWEQYMKDFAMNVSERWSELLFLRTDLSSK